MNYYLVDYENVKSHGLDGIVKMPPEDVVSIFYSENADTMTFSLHQKLNETRAHVIYEKVEVGTKNALDFQLVTELGYLIRDMQDQDVSFYIVSKDKGYGNTVTYWKKRGVRIAQVVDVSGLNEEKIENDLKMRVEPLVRDKEVVNKVVKMILQYKTKQGINNALMKEFPSNNNKRASEIYTAIKPLLSDKKGTVETPQVQAEVRAEMPQSRFEKQSEIFESILMKSDNLPAGPVKVPMRKEEQRKNREELPKKEEQPKQKEETKKPEDQAGKGEDQKKTEEFTTEKAAADISIPVENEDRSAEKAVNPEAGPKSDALPAALEAPKQEEKPQKAKRTNARRKTAAKKAEAPEARKSETEEVPAAVPEPAAFVNAPAEAAPGERAPAKDIPEEAPDKASDAEAPSEKTVKKKTKRTRKTAGKSADSEKVQPETAASGESSETAEKSLEKDPEKEEGQAPVSAAPSDQESEKQEKPKRNYRRKKTKTTEKTANAGNPPKEEA